MTQNPSAHSQAAVNAQARAVAIVRATAKCIDLARDGFALTEPLARQEKGLSDLSVGEKDALSAMENEIVRVLGNHLGYRGLTPERLIRALEVSYAQ